MQAKRLENTLFRRISFVRSASSDLYLQICFFRSVIQVEFGCEALPKMVKKALLPQICVLNWRLIVGSISRSQLKALDGDNILDFGQKEACGGSNWCSTSTRSTGKWVTLQIKQEVL